MIGEVNSFRKRFFGGFNQRDVVDYIAKLSKERNTHREEVQKLADEATMLRHELERAQNAEPDAPESGEPFEESDEESSEEPVEESVEELDEEPVEELLEEPVEEPAAELVEEPIKEPPVETPNPVSGLKTAVDSIRLGDEAMQKLADGASALHHNFKEASGTDKTKAFESAEKTFLELKNAFASARLSIETAHGFIRSELANAELPIIALPPVIEKTEEHLNELRSYFANHDSEEDDPFSLRDSENEAL